MPYPLGWAVLTQTLIQRERWPAGQNTRAVSLVYPGQEVQPDQPVIRLERAEPSEASREVPHPALSSQTELPSTKVGGDSAGQASIASGNETIPAGLRGRVIDVTPRGGVIIESRALAIQGAIGVGNQVVGILTLWQTSSRSQGQPRIPPGAILLIPGPLTFALLRFALSSGIPGIVASSIAARDLEGFLRTDLVALIDSANIEQAQEHLPPITILLTEGLGMLAMPARTMNILSKHLGSIVLLSGATSVRRCIFPELLISLPAGEGQSNWYPVVPDPALALGAHVRVCSGEHEGALGQITYLSLHCLTFPSGIRARAARLHLEGGSALVVPLALIERIA